MNGEVERVAPEAVAVIHRSMDLFLRRLADDVSSETKEHKRVTMQYKDFAARVFGERSEDQKYEFLRPVFTRSAAPSVANSPSQQARSISPLKPPAGGPKPVVQFGAGAAKNPPVGKVGIQR